MTTINSLNNLPINSNSAASRFNNEQDDKAELQTPEQAGGNSTKEPSQDNQLRRTQALQSLSEQSFRIRKDDDSDLDLKTRNALNEFQSLELNQNKEKLSNLIGIDTFA